MQSITVKIKKLSASAMTPKRAHPGDSGFDLFSVVDTNIQPGEHCLIPTGISMELPPNTEAQIRSRSGLALKHQVVVLNSPGTIDSGYRGEIGVILINLGSHPIKIKKHMKIAQMVIKPILNVRIEVTKSIKKTKRGSHGFGSTDSK